MRLTSVLRSVLLVVFLVLGLASPSGAANTEGFSESGTILVPNPTSRVIGGVTEIASPCMGSVDPDVPEGSAQGLDGYWIAIPYDEATGTFPFAGRSATLTADAPNDVDAWFYDPTCALIQPGTDENAYSMTTLDQAPNGNEEGIIPQVAAWVAVDLYAGAAANFTFTIDGAEDAG